MIEIRPAKPEEYEEVAAVIVDAYAEHAASMSPDAWSMFAQDIANVHGRSSDGELVVAVADGQIVGTLTIYRRWRGAQEGSTALRLLAVPPQHRHQGVGTALLEWCVEQARQDGKDRVVLTTLAEMTKMRELTESMGFVRDTSLDHEPAPGVRAEGFVLKL